MQPLHGSDFISNYIKGCTWVMLFELSSVKILSLIRRRGIHFRFKVFQTPPALLNKTFLKFVYWFFCFCFLLFLSFYLTGQVQLACRPFSQLFQRTYKEWTIPGKVKLCANSWAHIAWLGSFPFKLCVVAFVGIILSWNVFDSDGLDIFSFLIYYRPMSSVCRSTSLRFFPVNFVTISQN